MVALHKDFKGFKENQGLLIDLVSKSESTFSELYMKGIVEAVKRMADRVRSDRLKVLVLGEFKRGKSTFINALLGAEILPAYAIPCTAVINELKWGEEKRAVLHFCSPLPDPLSEKLPEEVSTHIQRSDGKKVPPMNVPIEDLKRYVAIPDPAKDPAESVAETPYELVEIYWPIELCKNGVEIIDSPGLNESGTRTKITSDYLADVDAVIFVMSCHSLGSLSEIKFIDNYLRGAGYEEIFIVCNRFDEIIPEERMPLVKFAKQKFSEKTSFGSDGVYFISARDALRGRAKAQGELLQRSGILPLEDHLSKFLANDRGKIKLLQPARELNNYLIKAAFDNIPSERKMLEKTIEELEQYLEQSQPQLNDVERRRQQIMEKLNRSRIRIKDDVRRDVTTYIKELAWKVPEWIEEYEPEHPIAFVAATRTKKQAEELVKEIAGHISIKLEDEYLKWLNNRFKPYLAERLTDLTEEVEGGIQELLDIVDGMKANLTGLDAREVLDKQRFVGPIERVLAAGVALVFLNPAYALVGGMLGFKQMMLNFAGVFAVALGMVLLQAVNPGALLLLLLGGGVVQGIIGSQALTNRLKRIAGEDLANKLRDSAHSYAEELSEMVYEKTGEFAEAIDAGLQEEIQDVRSRVDNALSRKRAGGADVKERRNVLDQVASNIRDIQTQLDEIIFGLAG